MDRDRKIKITKTVVGVVTSLSVGKVVSTAIANNTKGTGVYTRVACFVGSMIVSGMVCNEACAYTDETIDDFVKAWDELKIKKNFNATPA